MLFCCERVRKDIVLRLPLSVLCCDYPWSKLCALQHVGISASVLRYDAGCCFTGCRHTTRLSESYGTVLLLSPSPQLPPGLPVLLL